MYHLDELNLLGTLNEFGSPTIQVIKEAFDGFSKRGSAVSAMVVCCCEAWVYRDAEVKMNGKEELGLENQTGIVLHEDLVPAGCGSSPENQAREAA